MAETVIGAAGPGGGGEAGSGSGETGESPASGQTSTESTHTPASTGGEGASVPDSPFLSSVLQDPELKDNSSLSRYEDVDALGRAYIALEKRLGEKGVTIPGESSTPEEQAAYYKAIGVPDTAEGYGIDTSVFTLPEGAQAPSAEELTGFLDCAHQLKLKPDQVEGVLKYYGDLAAKGWDQVVMADEQQSQLMMEGLKEHWQPAQIEGKLAIAAEAVHRRFGNVDFLGQAVQTVDGQTVRIGNSPELAVIMAEWGEAHGHDKFVIGDSKSGFLDATGAKARLDQAYEAAKKGEINNTELTAAIEKYGPLANG